MKPFLTSELHPSLQSFQKHGYFTVRLIVTVTFRESFWCVKKTGVFGPKTLFKPFLVGQQFHIFLQNHTDFFTWPISQALQFPTEA